MLVKKRRDLIIAAAKSLDESRMIRFSEEAETFAATDLGRISSHYYVKQETVLTFNEQLKPSMRESDILGTLSQASEFENVQVREEEMPELETLQSTYCFIPVKGGIENKHGKVNVLLQAFLSNAPIDGFALVTDSAYIAQNGQRIFRCLFEIVLKRGWVSIAEDLLKFSIMMERRMWHKQHPLRFVLNS